MQRALGIRLMTPAGQASEARDLLARARAGEFATDEGDDLPELDAAPRAAVSLIALAAFATGGFWGTSLPRRLRGPSWQGMLLAALLFVGGSAILLTALKLILDPP